MSKPKRSRATKAFEKAVTARGRTKCVLRLYVAGASARSSQAVLRARQLCAGEPAGTIELEVIDVYQQPILARDGQIVATPTLVREFPVPVRRFFGDLAKVSGLFVGLDLHTRKKGAP